MATECSYRFSKSVINKIIPNAPHYYYRLLLLYLSVNFTSNNHSKFLQLVASVLDRLGRLHLFKLNAVFKSKKYILAC